jgi:GxxExxY protein
MPISVDTDVGNLAEEYFKEVAYAVTGVAFTMHNEYGSFFAEKLYKFEIAAECRKLGFRRVEVEVPIHVTYAGFRKDYYADLLIDGGALLELKVVQALTEEHRAQTLNYLFLMGLQRAKLLNLGAASVQHEFVSTTLSLSDRKDFAVGMARWKPIHDYGDRFSELMIGLLNDWGCFLQLPLYYEAITHFFGGEENVIRDTPVIRDGVEVTTHKVHLLTPDTAFKVTAVGDHLETVEEHMRRFLHHTPLRTIQWVNLYQHDVTFTTLSDK